MKGKKLVIALILALTVCLVLIPNCAFAESEENPAESGNLPTASAEAQADTVGDAPAETPDGGNPADGNPGELEPTVPVGDEQAAEENTEELTESEAAPAPSDSPAPVDENQTVEEKTEKLTEPEETIASSDSSPQVEEKSEEATEPDAAAAPAESSTEPEKRNYTLTLKNGDKRFVAAGDSATSVSQIFEELEVSGEIESIEGSNSDLFTVEKDSVTGEWVLVSKQPFTTKETVTVKLTGRDEPIIIEVSDPEEVLVDLYNGNVTVQDNGDSDKPIVVNYYNVGKSLETVKVKNGSAIRVKQTDSASSSTANTISIILSKASSSITAILDSLNISGDGYYRIYAETAEPDSTVTLELDGENVVKSTDQFRSSAICAYGEGTLVIQDKNDTAGSLVAESKYEHAATIGGWQSGDVGNIVISHAKVTVKANTNWGAAIGGGQYGDVKSIVIEDNAEVEASNSGWGAAIGGGQYGDVGSIVIRNSVVNAKSTFCGAAIGGGQEGKVDSIIIEDNADVTAISTNSGAAVGGGQYNDVGSIAIKDSAVNATSKSSAAIGAGQYGAVEKISIENSDVTAKSINSYNEASGANCGAAIGAGAYGGDNSSYKGDKTYAVKEISISNSDVKAESSANAIGAGNRTPASRMSEFKLTVSGTSAIDAAGNVENNCYTDTFFTAVGYGATYVEPDTTGLAGVRAVVEDDNTHFYTEIIPVFVPDVVPEQTTKKDTNTLVEASKDSAGEQASVAVEGTTAKITVTDDKGEFVAPQEVTIKSVAALESTGATEASIQLDTKLVLDLDVATIKNAGASDVVTVTNEDSVITVKSGETALVSVDVKAVVSETEQNVTVKLSESTVKVVCGDTAYSIDLSELGDVGTLTLKLENGVLKVYDKNGNLLKEIEKA